MSSNWPKQIIIEALRRWIEQRPGLEFANYGEIRAYRAEQLNITRDLHHARELLRAVEFRDSITGEDILRAANGRLTLSIERQRECECGHKWSAPVKFGPTNNLSGELTSWCPKCGKRPAISHPQYVRVDYCTGQYFPTEYRPAVSRVLSSVLWAYWRENMAEPDGDALRRVARRELSRAVAVRYFN